MDLTIAKCLFPLVKLEARLSDYFISTDGTIFSTKQTPAGRRMYGTGNSQAHRYVTLNNVSYPVRELLARAKIHSDFARETGLIKTVEKAIVASEVSSDRRHATTIEQGLAQKGWMIGRVDEHKGEKFIVFGSRPKIHLTADSVTSELTRLATAKPGVKFFSVKVDKSVIAGAVMWS